jgi:signal transduction histidine kinase
VKAVRESGDVSVMTSVGRHLAFSPVAFAVTEGPTHVVRYANAAFRQLRASGDVAIGQPGSGERPAADLKPLLDRAFRGAETVRDELLAPDGGEARWSCTVWAIAAERPVPQGLVVEVRDTAYIEGAMARQRAIAERLLLAALREQDNAREAVEAGRRATLLASASRELALSLDQDETRDIVRRRGLSRAGTWCIVDVIESNGSHHRLTVVHPDPAKQDLARTLTDQWDPAPDDLIGAPRVTRGGGGPIVITKDSEAALVAAAHGPQNLAILRELGFGALLVVPLVVRARVLGAITFVTRENDPPLTPEEIMLASDLSDRCAMALDNARLYREADKLRSEADVANRAKSDFLANMSHELRTPLNVIGGYTELMELGLRGPVTAAQQTDLARIQANQRHLLMLITEILDFVRSESGRMEYRFDEVSAQGALVDVADTLTGAVKQREISVVQRAGETDALVWADPVRVRQILMNLVMNAAKYTPASSGPITLSFTETADAVHLHVTDAGPGIRPEKLQTIFEPFVQLASGLSNRQGGVGLGLAISRDLARGMHGDLTIESTVDIGSRFTLTLPRRPPDTSPA